MCANRSGTFPTRREPVKRRYVTADVFTDRMFGGNPVAIVLDTADLSTGEMQSIALEFNYSETTFVLPPRHAAHTANVRIFTPRTEIPFAGHPNIGTAFMLARESAYRAAAAARRFDFEEAAGLVSVRLIAERGEIVGAELQAPERLSLRSHVAPEQAAACLSLSPQDVELGLHAPQVISVGLPFLVVEISDREALRRAQPNLAAYREILPLDGADAVFAYTRDHGGDLHARMFSPLDGIVEDPATGSAAAATAALLATTLARDGQTERSWRIHQGVDMGRPSVLMARTTRRNGTVEAVHIGGRCVAVMQGTLET
jgi:trans-2,3-dihydro-3-hydroxyanthranilate isomerase